MRLIKVTNKGSLHFRMSDGRLGVSYESGYIRVSVKGSNRLYQVNKKITHERRSRGYCFNERVLIKSGDDRLKALLAFDLKNCQ